MPSSPFSMFPLNLAQAVCCNDHVHCCPAGMQCDVEHDRCMSGEWALPLVKKIAAVVNEGIYFIQKMESVNIHS